MLRGLYILYILGLLQFRVLLLNAWQQHYSQFRIFFISQWWLCDK